MMFVIVPPLHRECKQNDGLKDIQDSVASIRNAVRYVRSSSARLHKFKELVKGLNILDKTALILDLPTRWNSTYLMLEGALKFQKAFDQMEEEDGHYVAYFDGKALNAKAPNAKDLASAKVFVRFLKIFYVTTLKFSCTLSVSSNTCLLEVSNIEEEINDLIKSDDVVLKEMALSMKRKFDKYWGNISKMNNLLLIACALDPRLKLQYVSICYEDVYGVEGSIGLEITMKKLKDFLVQLYDWYSERRDQTNVDDSSLTQTSQPETIGGKKWDRHFKKIEAQDICCNEVEKYLNEAIVKTHDDFDVQDWWKVNGARYKVLSDIARDVFAIPVSTVASESAFSIGGRILDPYRSCLTLKMVEVLVTTQNWIKSRAINLDHPMETLVEDVDFFDEIIDDMMGLSMTLDA